jgi:plastocyanin
MKKLAILPLVLLAAGCGGGNGETEPSAAPTGTAQQTITVDETEFALDPSTVRLDTAGTYTFRAVNKGQIDHALEIEGNGVEEETETIAAGESASLTVELAEGTYELYCPIGNHKEQGMDGSIVVGAGSAGSGGTTGETETENESSDDKGSDY